MVDPIEPPSPFAPVAPKPGIGENEQNRDRVRRRSETGDQRDGQKKKPPEKRRDGSERESDEDPGEKSDEGDVGRKVDIVV